jgi:hypothetical protein
MSSERDSDAAMDLPTAQSLVRLRLLAEDAARRASDISEAGRHQALVALDGACEHSLWLAARQDGIRLTQKQQSGLPALHSAIVEHRPGWMLRGWSGVNQMHEARNGAQHAGVAPDVQQLVAWADAAIGFIDSLCVAAFNTELKDIVLASAVRDPGLRALLTRAEGSVADETPQSFRTAEQAFEIARGRWRTQRNAAVPATSPTYVEPILASDESRMIAGLTETVASMEDWLEVQPFAGDLSEYIWFRRVGRERASVGWVPEVDDARRALVFAVGWIVRWEIFSFGYPEERWQGYRDGIEPPTRGDGSTVTVIGGQANMTLEAPGQPARNLLYLQLANVPNRGRPPWETVLQQAIADGMRGLRTEQDEPVFLRAYWNDSGVLAVVVNLDTDATVVADVLERAVFVAAQRFAESVADFDKKESKRRVLEERLRVLFLEADQELAVFGEPIVLPDDWLGTLGFMAFIPIRAAAVGGDSQETYFAENAFGDQRLQLPNFHWRDNGLAFTLTDLTDEMEAAIRTSAANADQSVARLRELRTKQTLTHTQFADRITERFGALPGREQDHRR